MLHAAEINRDVFMEYWTIDSRFQRTWLNSYLLVSRLSEVKYDQSGGSFQLERQYLPSIHEDSKKQLIKPPGKLFIKFSTVSMDASVCSKECKFERFRRVVADEFGNRERWTSKSSWNKLPCIGFLERYRGSRGVRWYRIEAFLG